MKPDRDKANAIKAEFYSNKNCSQAPKTITKMGKLKPKTLDFLRKLDNGLYSEFTSTDWIMYFQKKFKEATGYGYKIDPNTNGYSQSHSIFKSLIANFNPKDIKLMIDFLLDAEHDIKPKNQVGIYMLSKGWLDGIYRDATLWRDGAYMTKAQFKAKQYQESIPKPRNREWIPTKEEDNEEVSIMPKRKKRSTISL